MRASVKVSKEKLEKCQTKESAWDTAIGDAETELRLLSRQRARIQQALRIFKLNKKDGMEWPGGFLCRPKASCAEDDSCAKPRGLA